MERLSAGFIDVFSLSALLFLPFYRHSFADRGIFPLPIKLRFYRLRSVSFWILSRCLYDDLHKFITGGFG